MHLTEERKLRQERYSKCKVCHYQTFTFRYYYGRGRSLHCGKSNFTSTPASKILSLDTGYLICFSNSRQAMPFLIVTKFFGYTSVNTDKSGSGLEHGTGQYTGVTSCLCTKFVPRERHRSRQWHKGKNKEAKTRHS